MANVLFVNPPVTTNVEPELPVGIISLISNMPPALRRHLSFSVTDLNLINYSHFHKGVKIDLRCLMEKELHRLKPDIVAITAISSNYPTALGIAKFIKMLSRETCVIFGGPQATFTARKTLSTYDFIDFIVMGEGEKTFAALLQYLKGNGGNLNNIKGLCYTVKDKIYETEPQELIGDLNALEMLNFGCINLDEYKDVYEIKDFFLPLEAGRGCPFDCKFCSTSLYWRRKYRVKTPERIIEELTSYCSRYNIRKFKLAHDNLTFDRAFLIKLCDALEESHLNIRWFGNSRMDHLTRDSLQKLSNSGCVSLFYGIETLNRQFLKGRRKQYNSKYFRRFLKGNIDVGIVPILSFIYDFPDETREDIERTLRHILRAKLEGANRVLISQLIPEVKTEYYEENKDRLIICEPAVSEMRDSDSLFEENDIVNYAELFTHFYRIRSKSFPDYTFLPFLERFYGAVFNMIPRSIMFLHKVTNRSFVDIALSLFVQNGYTDLCNGDVYSKMCLLLSGLLNNKYYLRCLKDLLKYEIEIYTLYKTKTLEKKSVHFESDILWLVKNVNKRFLRIKCSCSKMLGKLSCEVLFKRKSNDTIEVYEIINRDKKRRIV